MLTRSTAGARRSAAPLRPPLKRLAESACVGVPRWTCVGVSRGVDASGSGACGVASGDGRGLGTGGRPLTTLVAPDGTELSVPMVDPGRADPDPPGDSGAVLIGARGEVDPVGVSGAVLVGLRGEMGSVGVAEGVVSPLGMTVVGVRGGVGSPVGMT